MTKGRANAVPGVLCWLSPDIFTSPEGWGGFHLDTSPQPHHSPPVSITYPFISPSGEQGAIRRKRKTMDRISIPKLKGGHLFSAGHVPQPDHSEVRPFFLFESRSPDGEQGAIGRKRKTMDPISVPMLERGHLFSAGHVPQPGHFAIPGGEQGAIRRKRKPAPPALAPYRGRSPVFC